MIRIGSHEIGLARPFVIAEAGINHNGNLEQAFAMIDAAKATGADAVKFQTFRAEEFVTDCTAVYTYISQGREITEPMIDLFKRHEFPAESWRAIKTKCDDAGIVFLSTPQNRSDLDLLLEIGIPAVKIGSDDFNNLQLVRDYAAAGLPLLLSCGMANIGEIQDALSAARAFDDGRVILLLCTSQYPTPPADANMRRLKTLAAAFPGLTLGFSDHTQGATAACMAVALGAVVFEKHFTLSHDLPGPDHWFSEDPAGMTAWVAAIHEAASMLGRPHLRATAAEESIKLIARRSIVAVTDIRIGDTFDSRNIALKRPGTGLPPALFDTVNGRRAMRDVKAGEQLGWGDFK